MSHDTLQSFMLPQTPVRGAIVRLQTSLQTIINLHQYPATINQLMGETLASMLLITNQIKWQGRFVLQFQGKGALNMLVARMNDQRGISAMAKWTDPLPHTTKELLNEGQLQSSLIHEKKEPQQSIIPIHPLGMAESLENYFTLSEQIPSKIWLSGDEHHINGLLLQAMPSADQSFDLGSFTQTLNEQHIDFNQDNTTILTSLMNEYDCQIFEEKPIQFFCGCSLEKMQSAIFSMGQDAAQEALKEQDFIDVQCDFCGKSNHFGPDDVQNIFLK